ncbi:5-bromo-4-chloroindolyl phosphate hydrolysis family protein [Atopobiaceae bacterium 24-176]
MAGNDGKDALDKLGSLVQDAIDNNDFAELSSMVNRTVQAAGEGVRKAQEAVAASVTEARRKEEERLARERVAARYGSSAGLKASGFFAALFGLMFTLAFLMGFMGLLMVPIFLWDALVMDALFAICSIFLLRYGLRRISLARRYDTYRRVIGSREACTLAELSQQVGHKVKFVRGDVRTLIVKGLFREGRLSSSGRTLVLTEGAYAAVEEQERAAAQARKAKRRSQPVEAKVERVETERPAEEEAPFDVNGAPESVRPLLRQGAAYLAKIEEANEAIDDAQVSAKVDRISCVATNIFVYAAEHPEVASDLERFMNYYLPTTVKLLKAYDDLEEQPVQGVNISTSRKEIEQTLDTLTVAFERLLDSIFRDMTWDVSADISVLNDVLAQEGLIDKGGPAATD